MKNKKLTDRPEYDHKIHELGFNIDIEYKNTGLSQHSEGPPDMTKSMSDASYIRRPSLQRESPFLCDNFWN